MLQCNGRVPMVIALLATASGMAQSLFTQYGEIAGKDGHEFMGLVSSTVAGSAVQKRAVIRVPTNWNNDLVIGAHGGSGGDAIDRSGKVYATSETALDDVIGDYAYKNGFAYASIDRDGIGNSREGVALTLEFAEHAKAEVRLRTRGNRRHRRQSRVRISWDSRLAAASRARLRR